MAPASVVLLFALGFLGCSAQPQKVYTAKLDPLDVDGTSSGVTGTVTVFQDAGKSVSWIGKAEGLEENLIDCNPGQGNSCGVHVHSGTGCADSVAQGGHYFGGPTDPWTDKVYVASGEFKGTVPDSMDSVSGKAFVVHNKAGDRVACGILTAVTTGVQSAVLEGIGTNTVEGAVTTYISGGDVFVAGYATGLQAAVGCGADNKCGAHVHTGTGCADAVAQGGHYHDAAADPWAVLGYEEVDAGKGWFAFKAAAGVTSVSGKAFVVHDDQAARVSCGVLGGEVAAGTALISTAHSSVAFMAQLALMAAIFCMIA